MAGITGIDTLKAGQLSEALKEVVGAVKAKPSDLSARTAYFELLCLLGDLDRAAKQLDVITTTDASAGVGIYRGALQAERERQQFFHGGARPRIIGPAAEAEACLEAIEYYARGNAPAAAKRLHEAAEQTVPVAGKLNGHDVSGLGDSCDLLGPFLEAVMEDHYTWISWSTILSLSIPQPRYLRDTIWSPVSLELSSGGHGEALVFALYVDSHTQADEVKLGRETVWMTDPHEFTIAYGQKVIATDEDDYPLLEMRSFEVAPCP